MLRLAITGGIACGKSVVGSLFAENGVPVCDSDDLAHQAMMRGTDVYRKIVEAFGRRILGRDGEIVRSRLGRIVFASPAKLAALNRIVHPHVKVAWEVWLQGLNRRPAAAVIVPLLYEEGFEAGWDSVVCVSAPYCDRMAWLKDRGLTDREVKIRMAAQMPIWRKMELADRVVYNCGSLELLKEQSVKVLNELLERKHA